MKKAIIFFCLTGVFWALSLFFGIRFVKSILEASNADLAKVEAPGSVIFPIETAGTVSLWHNYRDFHNGKTVGHEPVLPGGYGFELREMGSTVTLPFVPSRIDSNVNGTQVSKTGLGSFEIVKAGDYELTVTAPPGESRIISLSEGSILSLFGQIFSQGFGMMIPGFAGLVTLLLAIVFLVMKPKPKPPLPSHAS